MLSVKWKTIVAPCRLSAPPSPRQRPVRVFLACTGLGRQWRGFETFTLECADALRADPRIALTVFAGGDVPGVPARVRWNLRRDGTLSSLVAAVVRRDRYFVEQATFFLSFLPALVLGRPDVVYFADLNLGNLCWHWRRLSGQRFKLLYYNGGLTTRPFTRVDMVQQLTPAGLAEAVARGESRQRRRSSRTASASPTSCPRQSRVKRAARSGSPPTARSSSRSACSTPESSAPTR